MYYTKINGVLRILRLRLPAGKAVPGPAVSPVLGPFGLKAKDFVLRFNKDTLYLKNLNILVEVYLFLLPGKEYDLKVRFPSVVYFTRVILQGGSNLTRLSLFKLVRMRLEEESIEKIHLINILGSLQSSHIGVKDIFKRVRRGSIL